MKLEQLSHILAVEKYHSVSEAARRLYISQPALSTSISNLEEELNVRIFKRGAKGSVPTRQGLAVLQLARDALQAIEQMQSIGHEQEEMIGDVHLLLSHAYRFIVPELIMRFRAKYPQANLIIEERAKKAVVEEISQGLYQLGLIAWGIVPDEEMGYLKERNLEFELYGKRRVVAYVSKAHAFAQQEQLRWPQLSGQQIVLPSENLTPLLAGYGLSVPDNTLIMGNQDNLKKMVADNFAIAVMPDNYMIGDLFIEYGLIKVVSIAELNCCGRDCLLTAKKRRRSLLEESLLDILRDMLQEYETGTSCS